MARALSRAEARCLEISLSKLVYKYIYVYIHSVLYKCIYSTDIAISDLLGVLPSVSACSRHLLIDLEVLYRRHSLYSSQTQNIFFSSCCLLNRTNSGHFINIQVLFTSDTYVLDLSFAIIRKAKMFWCNSLPQSARQFLSTKVFHP